MYFKIFAFSVALNLLAGCGSYQPVRHSADDVKLNTSGVRATNFSVDKQLSDPRLSAFIQYESLSASGAQEFAAFNQTALLNPTPEALKNDPYIGTEIHRPAITTQNDVSFSTTDIGLRFKFLQKKHFEMNAFVGYSALSNRVRIDQPTNLHYELNRNSSGLLYGGEAIVPITQNFRIGENIGGRDLSSNSTTQNQYFAEYFINEHISLRFSLSQWSFYSEGKSVTGYNPQVLNFDQNSRVKLNLRGSALGLKIHL